jgi:allantoicase
VTDFQDLPDLANEDVGGAAILCNDEFFADKENLLRARPAEWREHAYTDRGKWMDGWETRRYRPADGVAPDRDSDVHDWCVIRLGLPGAIRGVVVDTSFFRGNFPDTCAVEATAIDDALDLGQLETSTWTTIVPRAPLEGHHANVFAIAGDLRDVRFTHVRLRIYPDGGVARLRVHGRPVPRWDRLRGHLVDLAALEHGAIVETASDMFFGSRANLIKPGPSRSMADGWETRRRRGPGHDWALIKLAAPGTIDRLELDTSHFKGNAPARCTVEGSKDKEVWRPLLATPLQPHTRHVFDAALRRIGDVGYLKLSVYPCGGMARLRAWGLVSLPVSPGLVRLNAMTPLEATASLLRCCASSQWAAAMTGARPFADTAVMLRVAEQAWWALGEADYLEAFAAHPRIGENRAAKPTGSPPLPGSSGSWSVAEQANVATAAELTRAALAEANRAYEAKHGFIYIVCASGRTADAMLADLLARLERSRPIELRTAAEEQMKITRLRLAKLLTELGAST